MAYSVFGGCCCYSCCIRRKLRGLFDIEVVELAVIADGFSGLMFS